MQLRTTARKRAAFFTCVAPRIVKTSLRLPHTYATATYRIERGGGQITRYSLEAPGTTILPCSKTQPSDKSGVCSGLGWPPPRHSRPTSHILEARSASTG